MLDPPAAPRWRTKNNRRRFGRLADGERACRRHNHQHVHIERKTFCRVHRLEGDLPSRRRRCGEIQRETQTGRKLQRVANDPCKKQRRRKREHGVLSVGFEERRRFRAGALNCRRETDLPERADYFTRRAAMRNRGVRGVVPRSISPDR